MGDYLDCYPYEFSANDNYREHAIGNFNEIINLKKENKNRVNLLLGNHKENIAF